MDKIEIPLRETKTLIILLGALSSLITGIVLAIRPELIIRPEIFTTTLINNPETIKYIGIAFASYGAYGIYGFGRTFNKKIGLIVDQYGITDNTNLASGGLIEWNDITEIKTEEVFLLIFISNPEKYINKVRGLKQKLMKANMKMYGTPLAIRPSILRYNLGDLEKLIRSHLDKYR